MPVSVNRAKIVHDSVPTLLQQEEIYWQFEYLRTHNNWKNLKAEDVKEYIFDQLSSEKEIKNLNGEYKGLNYKGTITTSKVSNIKVTDYSNYKEKAEITGEWLDVMQELIDKAKSLDINVLFLSAPYSADKLQTAYLNTLTELFDEEGVDFLNCNNFYDEIGIDFTSDFYDDRHANLLGLEKTTKFVGAYLKEKYGLEKSDLTESQAQEWQKAADLWYDEVFYPGSEKIMNYVAKQKAKGNTNY